MNELDYYKSPYGKAIARLQRNTDNWLVVVTPEGKHRYFFATNWTYFEKDKATEITEDEYLAKGEEIRQAIEAEIARRAANGGKF